MKYAWAVPGAKVVCIGLCDRSEISDDCMGDLPVVGETYTINEVTISPWGTVVLGIAELAQDTLYGVIMFRPLRTVEDDVALFAHHLTPAPTDLTVA